MKASIEPRHMGVFFLLSHLLCSWCYKLLGFFCMFCCVRCLEMKNQYDGLTAYVLHVTFNIINNYWTSKWNSASD